MWNPAENHLRAVLVGLDPRSREFLQQALIHWDELDPDQIAMQLFHDLDLFARTDIRRVLIRDQADLDIERQLRPEDDVRPELAFTVELLTMNVDGRRRVLQLLSEIDPTPES